MSSKTGKVSANFAKFMGKSASAIADAKKAENSLATCAMPLGWKGYAVCTDGVADQGKDRKNDKGEMIPGNPYIRLEFTVINDPSYAGKKFSKAWSFFDSAKASAADRYAWCLNELQNMGLPRDIRESHETPEELFAFFLNSETVFDVEVIKPSYIRQGSDGKEVKVTQGEVVDSSTSMAPGGSSSAPVQTSSPKKLEVGATVSFADNPWEVASVSEDGQELEIKSPRNGSVRKVKVTDLD